MSTLNPRGKLWSNDKNKFGQKMLEKYGWKEGQGLGKDEDGVKEHIKVKLKSDNQGLGYKPKSYDDQWILNNDNYEELLSNLANHHKSTDKKETKVSNLEENLKKRKNSLFYHKFVRSKNLGTRSDKELNSIFPKSKQKLKAHQEKQIDRLKNKLKEENLVNSSLDINQYFKMKMKKKKN